MSDSSQQGHPAQHSAHTRALRSRLLQNWHWTRKYASAKEKL